MKAVIMIVIIYSSTGKAVTDVEFDSMDSCKAAIPILYDMNEKRHGFSLVARCVYK